MGTNQLSDTLSFPHKGGFNNSFITKTKCKTSSMRHACYNKLQSNKRIKKHTLFVSPPNSVQHTIYISWQTKKHMSNLITSAIIKLQTQKQSCQCRSELIEQESFVVTSKQNK